MTTDSTKEVPGKVRDKLRKLFALIGSDNAGERETARTKIDELLAKHKKTWNDLVDLITAPSQPGPADDAPDDVPPTPAPLDLIYYFLKKYLQLDERQLVAVTLWVAHTFVFHRFSHTPRLVFYSPVRGCGKTTALDAIAALGYKAERLDNITAAVLFRLIDRTHATVLVDEADNQDLPNNKTLLAVANSGHRRGGKVSRYLRGEVVKFETFAPLAFATISRLPLPLLHRSIVISMIRASMDLERFDPGTIPGLLLACDAIHSETFNWAAHCTLDPDPAMPEELRNRAADNWRVLISIADSFCKEWSEKARAAAVTLSEDQDEDLGVRLLLDIRDVFDRQKKDRLASAVLAGELNGLADAPWSEWRGQRGDQSPRPMSQAQLAGALAPFRIRPKTIWPLEPRELKTKSAKGYSREQFEVVWSSYCTGTTAQRSNVRYLSKGA